jgi:hypothetical protein
MGSNQNPIHRDRDKRGKGEQPYQDDKEAFRQNETDIHRTGDIPGDQGDGLTHDQREQLQKQAASERLARVQHEVEEENSTR